MSIEIDYTADGTGVIFKGRGEVTAEDILALRYQLYCKPERIAKMKYLVNDFTDVVLSEKIAEDLLIESIQDKEAAMINPHVVVAIVATHELYRKIMEIWHVILSSLPWRTFSTQSYFEATQYIRKYAGVDLLYLK